MSFATVPTRTVGQDLPAADWNTAADDVNGLIPPTSTYAAANVSRTFGSSTVAEGDNATSGSCVIPATGLYLIQWNGNVELESGSIDVSNGGGAVIALYKNGAPPSTWVPFTIPAGVMQYAGGSVSAWIMGTWTFPLLQCDAGDVIELFFANNCSGGTSVFEFNIGGLGDTYELTCTFIHP